MSPLHALTSPPILQLLSLTALTSSSSLHQSSVFRGRVSLLRPYSPHTHLATLTISSLDEPNATVEVECKGWWAEKVSRRFRGGETVVLKTKGGKIMQGSKKGKEKEGGEGKRRVRYEKGVEGWVIRKGGEEEVLRYSSAFTVSTSFDASAESMYS